MNMPTSPPPTFYGALRSMLNKRVSLNYGSDFAISGKLTRVEQDFIVVQTRSSVLHIPLAHLRVISVDDNS
jgi:hypothetical protein